MFRPRDPERFGMYIAVVASILFGLWPPAARAVYNDGADAVFMALAIVWARASGLTLFCLATAKPLFKSKEDRRQAFIGGFFQALSSGSVILALTFTPGPIVIMMIFTHTLMLLLLLVWKGELELDLLTAATTLAALVGLGLVLDLWHTQSAGNLWGIFLSFGAALAIVMRMYIYGKQTVERNPAVVGAENFLTAAALTSLILLFKQPHFPQSSTGYLWVALACTTMAIATFMMFYGISYLGSFRWSLYTKLEPVLTALFSVVLIHEILRTSQYVGMAIVLGSLAFFQLASHQKKVNELTKKPRR